jgi:alkaline phosphatase D
MASSRRQFVRAAAAAGLVGVSLREAGAQTAGVFRHGVASGDPLTNRVVLWTRVTPTPGEDPVVVEWILADDPAMRRVLQRGVTSTSAFFDYTVKVDVMRLDPGVTYYYQFRAQGAASPIGRTRTLPAGAVERLRFAFASCSNYPYGFFNSYRRIASRLDLDFVAHLGDYIYEYADGQYGDGARIGRAVVPAKEITTMADYRQRYAQYRTDPDLQEAHRQHPWIIVWDDHESANNAWIGGAENHTEGAEGEWAARRAMAVQAWFEWMPVRENPYLEGEIYRNFRFGDLMDLVMLDTRLEGRDEQMNSLAGLADPNRRLISNSQEAWFHQELTASRARGTHWRFVGQQVMMGQLVSPDGAPFNYDQWDGYPVTRNRLLNHLATERIGNVVVLTGDIHSSWANEISANPFVPTATPLAVEFVTPAVTSPGIDDRAQATALQLQVGATHPHVKYVELFRRGYTLVDLTRERAQAEFYHLRTITERNQEEELGIAVAVAAGENRVRPATASSQRPAAPPAP